MILGYHPKYDQFYYSDFNIPLCGIRMKSQYLDAKEEFMMRLFDKFSEANQNKKVIDELQYRLKQIDYIKKYAKNQMMKNITCLVVFILKIPNTNTISSISKNILIGNIILTMITTITC